MTEHAEHTQEPSPESAPAAPVLFEEFGLPSPLEKAIEALGFTACTPIQAETLPHALSDYDVVGQAQTGTGKTAAFLISIIAHQLEFPKDPLLPPGTPRALIVAPTRELAMQIADDAESLCKFSGLRVLSVVGGMDFERQRRILEDHRVDILVGTPGRLIDFITRGKLNLRQVEQLVLDEADRMLSMGFIPDVRRIVRQTPPKERRQTLLFSATFSETILRLASQWTLDAEQVVIEPESVATDRVEQRIYLVAEEDKFALLYNLMQDLELERVIVFANRRDSTRLIQTRLAALGVDCELLSGEVPQAKRLKTLERFKDGRTRVLAATDVAGRGLHVDGISHVINYDLPEDAEDYVHRIGRTGRAGRSGRSFTLVAPDDTKLLGAVESMLGKEIPAVELPDFETVEMEEGDNRRRRRSSGSSSSSGRSRSGSRSSSSREDAPQQSAAPAEAAESAAPAPSPKPASARQESRSRRSSEQPAKDERAPARRRSRREREDDTPLGFGDEVPAFFMVASATSPKDGAQAA